MPDLIRFQPANPSGKFAGKTFITPASHQQLVKLELRLMRAEYVGASYVLDSDVATAMHPVLERAAEHDQLALSKDRHDQLVHLARCALRKVEVADVLNGKTEHARAEAGRIAAGLDAQERAEFIRCLREVVMHGKKASAADLATAA